MIFVECWRSVHDIVSPHYSKFKEDGRAKYIDINKKKVTYFWKKQTEKWQKGEEWKKYPKSRIPETKKK